MKIGFSALALLGALSAQAAIESGAPPVDPSVAQPVAGAQAPVVVAHLDPISREERIHSLKENLLSLDDQLKLLKATLASKSKAFLELSQAQARPLFMWQEETDIGAKRDFLLKIASLDLKQLAKKIDSFQARREEISFELEWLGMDLQKTIDSTADAQPKTEKKKKTISAAARSKAAAFACNMIPVDALDGEKAQIVQGFGETKDPESGIKWQSSGWWVQRLKADVHACAPGKVAFSGKIPGRGSVVLVDHGGGIISLYANLLDNDLPQRGTKVDAGTRLGYLKDKFYFEVRRDGLAIDPKSTFAPERLAKFEEQQP